MSKLVKELARAAVKVAVEEFVRASFSEAGRALGEKIGIKIHPERDEKDKEKKEETK